MSAEALIRVADCEARHTRDPGDDRRRSDGHPLLVDGYCGPLASHAAMSFPRECRDPVHEHSMHAAALRPNGYTSSTQLSIGMAIAICRPVCCRRCTPSRASQLSTRERITPAEPALGVGDLRPAPTGDCWRSRDPYPRQGSPGLGEWEPPR